MLNSADLARLMRSPTTSPPRKDAIAGPPQGERERCDYDELCFVSNMARAFSPRNPAYVPDAPILTCGIVDEFGVVCERRFHEACVNDQWRNGNEETCDGWEPPPGACALDDCPCFDQTLQPPPALPQRSIAPSQDQVSQQTQDVQSQGGQSPVLGGGNQPRRANVHLQQDALGAASDDDLSVPPPPCQRACSHSSRCVC